MKAQDKYNGHCSKLHDTIPFPPQKGDMKGRVEFVLETLSERIASSDISKQPLSCFVDSETLYFLHYQSVTFCEGFLEFCVFRDMLPSFLYYSSRGSINPSQPKAEP